MRRRKTISHGGTKARRRRKTKSGRLSVELRRGTPGEWNLPNHPRRHGWMTPCLCASVREPESSRSVDAVSDAGGGLGQRLRSEEAAPTRLRRREPRGGAGLLHIEVPWAPCHVIALERVAARVRKCCPPLATRSAVAILQNGHGRMRRCVIAHGPKVGAPAATGSPSAGASTGRQAAPGTRAVQG